MMVRWIVLFAFLLSSIQAFAQPNDAEEYCKKLDEERGGFLDLAPPKEDKKLTPIVRQGLEKRMPADQVLAEAQKRRVRMTQAQIAAYKRDFYHANCTLLMDGRRISENLPPDQKYCVALAKIADEADRYMTNSKNIADNWSELNAISTAPYRDMTTEALEKMLSFEDYSKAVKAKYKAQGKAISLGKYARAQYTQMFYQKYCILEAEALNRPRTAAGTKTSDLSRPEFHPIEAEASLPNTSK
jgi:hypothetical protein